MASIADFYSRILAQEVMKGMRQKAIQGGTSGRAPIGYLNVRRQTEDVRDYRAIQLDRERAPHIAWAFATYAPGEWSVAQLDTALITEDLGLGRLLPAPPRR
ncbi:hypothetical protein [Microbacterium gilvum]|uniref:Uncharacterized protein n=1 Tax=Microbacterium gilvum TaxID=1336204 RepID=A0ABP9ATE6_9MICO